MAIDVSGLVPFTDGGAVPTLVVDNLAPSPLIPFAIFPEFRNDAGLQSFGGAKYISIFEDGVAEGTSSALITATTQALTSTVGGIQLAGTADPAVTYRVRIRLRSEINDPNFNDKLAVFRVVTPLMVPITTAEYAADREPGVTLSAGTYKFTAGLSPFTSIPAGEIRLRDGKGGIVLPNDFSAWGSEAQAFMADQLGRLKETVITIDFLPEAGVEAVMRLKYRVKLNSTLNGLELADRYRRQDFSTWGYFRGTDIDFIEATVDMVAETASVSFLRGLYSIGPRFETVTVVGNGGQVVVNPAAVQTGESIDVTRAIDFSRRSHLTVSSLQDHFLLLVCSTDEAIYIREIPLRPEGHWHHVGEDGVTNFWTLNPPPDAAAAALPLLFMRPLFFPFLEFPNLTAAYDVNDGFFPSGSKPVGQVPDWTNIRIYAGAPSGISPDTPNVTYDDEADLFNNTYAVRMPDIGIAKYVLDCRRLKRSGTGFTAIPVTTSFITIRADVRYAVSPDQTYEVTMYYMLNFDGQPNAWELETDPAIQAPTLAYDRETRVLSITLRNGTYITGSSGTLTVRGDLGSLDALASWVSPGPPFATPLSANQTVQVDVSSILSLEAEFVEVEYIVDGLSPAGTFIMRTSTRQADRLVEGTLSIGAIFTGTAVVFTDLSNVAVNAQGLKEIAIIGDGPPQVIPAAQENAAYHLNTQGGSSFHPTRSTDWIDLRYVAGTSPDDDVHTYRVFNSLFDFRTLNPRSLMIADKSAWGLGGGDNEAWNFSVPRMRFIVADGRVEIEEDGRTYDFLMWRFRNLVTQLECVFTQQMTQGRAYQLGGVLEGISTTQQILLTVLHRNGGQKDFLCTVDPSASPAYLQPKSTRLLGVL